MPRGFGADPPDIPFRYFIEHTSKLESGQCEAILLVGGKPVLHAPFSNFFIPGGWQGLVRPRGRRDVASGSSKYGAWVPDLTQVIKDPVGIGEIPKQSIVVGSLGIANGGQGSLHLGKLEQLVKVIGTTSLAVSRGLV